MAWKDNLIAFWRGNEASGNLLDSHDDKDATETSGTIGAAAAIIAGSDGSRDFELGDTEYFAVASDSDLNSGDIDFTVAYYINAETATGTADIISKFNGADTANSEWLTGTNGSSRLRFLVRNAANSANATVTANDFGNISASTAYSVICEHDSVNNTLSIEVNGVETQISHTGGVRSGTVALHFGNRPDLSNHYDGLLGNIGFWKRVLTADEKTAWHAGISYDDFEEAGGGLTIPIAAYHYNHHLGSMAS